MTGTYDYDSLVKLIREAFELALQDEVTQPMDLARLGAYLRKVDGSFSPRTYGFEKLRPLLQQLPSIVQLDKDEADQTPRFFVRLLDSGNFEQPPISDGLPESSKTIENKSTELPRELYDFTYIPDDKWPKLAELARDENWGGDGFPILKNYLKYTYVRLTHEKKIVFADSELLGLVASFNTGLVDRLFRPIYAFLVQNRNPKQPWFLNNFCVAGENHAGKQLVTTFNPPPESAYYFDNPADGVFDARAEVLVNWEHVIVHNVVRIPVGLLEPNTPGFEVKAPENLSEEEARVYTQNFKDYLRNNDYAHRKLIEAFEGALEMAKRKVGGNYKTAIPVYYPAGNSMSMLLPLSLLSNDAVDLALVVERQAESGNYQGQTIYPIDWAYKNARLIAKPESDWLIP